MKTENFKKLIESSESGLVSKSTIIGLVRSILTPLAENNANSLVFTRLRNRDEISGLIRRLEYCENVEMHDFLSPDVVKLDDFIEIEFVLITSDRFNTFLLWDYSTTEAKDKSPVYFLMNTKKVNDCFEVLQSRSKVNFADKFNKYRPERRDNRILNSALEKIVKILNENVSENEALGEFMGEQELQTAQKFENFSQIRANCHEIKNRLSILDIYTKLLEKELNASGEVKANKNIEMLKKSIALIGLELSEIRGLSDGRSEKREDIATIIEKSAQMFENLASVQNNKIIFKNHMPQNAVTVDECKLVSILINILKNANESTSNDEIIITLEADGSSAKIFVRNHGEKISPENIGKIFDEGFTTKENGWGTGLSAAKKYLLSQGGDVILSHSDENYTEFLVRIPLNQGVSELGIYI